MPSRHALKQASAELRRINIQNTLDLDRFIVDNPERSLGESRLMTRVEALTMLTGKDIAEPLLEELPTLEWF